MSIAIMQPYFFPYAGYFSLIKHTDRFIAFDTPQFIKHGWIERNRLSKPDEGWYYIRAPLIKHKLETPINQVRINNADNWKATIISQLTQYKKRAPFYYAVVRLLNDIFALETDDITAFNVHALDQVCRYLEIKFEAEVFSKMNLQIQPPHAPDEWALNICLALGEKTYINPEGGLEFFDKTKYTSRGIDIRFLKFTLPVYDQKNTVFEPGLSIIDTLMFNSPADVNKMLDCYELI